MTSKDRKTRRLSQKKAEEYEEEFARQVMEAKKSPETNHYVEKAKDYIYKHLHNVDIHRVWEETGINGDYLCRLFQKYEGCSVEEYIRKRKNKTGKGIITIFKLSHTGNFGIFIIFESEFFY